MINIIKSLLIGCILFAIMFEHLMVSGECIIGEKTFAGVPHGNGNHSIAQLNFHMNPPLKGLFKKDRRFLTTNFVAGTNFSMTIKYRYDNTKFVFEPPGIEYNDTTLATSLSVTTVIASSAFKINGIVSSSFANLMTTAAIAKISGASNFEAIAISGALAALSSSISNAYVNAAEECLLSIDITFTYIPGVWHQRKENFKERPRPGKDASDENNVDGDLEFTPGA